MSDAIKTKIREPKLSFREILKLGWGPYIRLIGYLRPYKTRFVLGLIFGAAYGAITGVVPFLVSYVTKQVFGQEISAQQIFSAANQAGEGGHRLRDMILVCSAIPLLMIVRSSFSYLNSYFMAWVSLRVLVDLRQEVFAHLTKQGLDFFNKQRGGHLISRVANDTRQAQGSLTTVSSDLIKQPMTLLVGAGALLAFDPKFTLYVLILFPVCLLPMFLFGRKARKAGQMEEKQMGGLISILQETFSGIRVIKAFAREPHEVRKFEKRNLAQYRNSLRVRRAMELVGPIVEVIAAIGVGLTLFYLYFTNASVERFLGLVAGIFLLYEPVKKLSRIHVVIQKGMSAAVRVFEVLDIAPTVRELPGAQPLSHVKGEIEFAHVSFHYEAGAAAVRDFNLKIETGKTYALVGESGAGKSTVLSLLLRFYDPQEGAILLDGKDIRHVTLNSLREQIGIVNQDTFLFHDTIMNNIRYGRLEATDDEVFEAAKQANAHEFILQQPHGYETEIGDKGCRLSGGQQQRLSIARALLKNAPILLLDEATSALDSRSEREIQTALDHLSQGRTVIAIAHRLSTILKADQIVMMVDGKIQDAAPHEQLLKRSSAYQRLYELQFHHHAAVA